MVDDCSKEAMRIAADTSIQALYVTRLLDQVKGERGLPKVLRTDNGPMVAGRKMQTWASRNGVALRFIEPGKPVHNAYFESFNSRFRDECLTQHWLASLSHMRSVIGNRREDCNRAIHRLRTGTTRRQDGKHDRRGGIVWHTQGSGKSLTMVFLMRKLRSDPLLRSFKVVVVTDRNDLERQLSETARLTGQNVLRAASADDLKKQLHRQGPDIVFGMMQKQRGGEAAGEPGLKAEELPKLAAREPAPRTYGPEVLNDGEAILVLVDEAYRSWAGDLQAALLAGLPNCAHRLHRHTA